MSRLLPMMFSLSVLVTLPATAANYFKCVGPDGSVIFSDTECPDSAQVVTEKTLKSGSLTGHVEGGPFQDGRNDLSLEQMLQIRSQLAEVISSLSPLKVAAAEHRASTGEWAGTLENLGFDSRKMSSSLIRNVRLGRSGSIIAQLDKSLGAEKMVVLNPREVLDGSQLEWECAANFSPLIMEKLDCESRKIQQ